MRNNYHGNESRIVRIQNDDLHAMLELVSDDLNLPYQWVFNVYINFVVVFGNNPDLNMLHSHCRAILLFDKGE